jgi:hypothetical protein
MDVPLIGARRKRVNPFRRRLFAIETGGISGHFISVNFLLVLVLVVVLVLEMIG